MIENRSYIENNTFSQQNREIFQEFLCEQSDYGPNGGQTEPDFQNRFIQSQSGAAMTRAVNENGFALVRHFEGCRLTAYRCPAGVLTIGYGSTFNVKPGQIITQDEAEARLRIDLIRAAIWVDQLVTADVTDDQFGALVSFVFNIGRGAFSGSTLLKKLNSGDFAGAAAEFSRWTKAGGVDLPGLVRRRAAERALFEGRGFQTN